MSIPDPFAPLNGSPLHRIDIATAEAATGVRGWSWSRHAVDPAVRAGAKLPNALAVLHWGIIGVVAVGVAVAASSRRT